MINAYSLDLQQRAVAYLLVGGQRKTACHIFQIRRDALYLWIRQYQTEGALATKPQGNIASRKLDDAVVAHYISATIPTRRWRNWGRDLRLGP